MEALDAQAVRQFFRWLKDQGLSDNGRHAYLRAPEIESHLDRIRANLAES